jgi:GAF domain-containing protein
MTGSNEEGTEYRRRCLEVIASSLEPIASSYSPSDCEAGARAILQRLCDQITSRVEGYDWVGFYVVDPERPDTLTLGPYSGAPTEHVRIPFGSGICGQAAERLEVFLVDDVSTESNYLACSPDVRSEIVLPIFLNGALVGELDIDSHTPGLFSELDREALEAIARLVSPMVGELASLPG